MTPSPRLLIIAIVGLAVSALPLLVHPLAWTAVVSMWAALALGVILDLAALLAARADAQVVAPRTVGVGEVVELPIQFRLRGGVRLGATVRGEVETPLEPRDDLEVRIPPGESVANLSLDAPRRGRGALTALWVRLRGPLGLVHRIHRFQQSAPPVQVLPNARRIRELTLEHFGSQPLGGGMKVERRAGDGGEFDAMLAYSQGMDVRTVDWKSSARHQDLRVRRYRLERNQRMLVCVDTGRVMADPIDGVQRLDHAIHAASVLARTALKAGDLVGLHAYGSEPQAYVAPQSGMRQAARIDRACAELEARPEETNHVLGIHALLTRLRRRSLIVMFTDFTDSTTAELMVEHLGHLARRHLIMFVALDDPVVEAPLDRTPRNAQDLAAAVIAGGLRQERHRVLRRLTRMGVDVIHGPPGPATLRLLARYVHVKRRGLIG